MPAPDYLGFAVSLRREADSAPPGRREELLAISDRIVRLATVEDVDRPDADSQRIRELAGLLKGMLDDPHPGLFTWAMLLQRHGTELRDLLLKKLPL